MKTFIFPLLLVVVSTNTFAKDCNERLIDKDHKICVCNATYCDTIPEIQLQSGSESFELFKTSKEKLGVSRVVGKFGKFQSSSVRVTKLQINRTKKYQYIIGFGGAFTDSTGRNVAALPTGAQSNLMESYFGPTGAQYSLCRVPVGGTDFSVRHYTYDDTPNDVDLDDFELQPEDILYKIPLIREAVELRGSQLKLFGTAWTAPPWMKTDNNWGGVGILKPKYYQVWAEYFVKFFTAYQAHNVSFWGMTTGNEPFDGFIPLNKLNSMGWTPITANKWIGNNLGPTIRNSSFANVKIILFDDNRFMLPFLKRELNNDKTLKYADGVGVHWYADFILPESFLDFTKTDRKDLFLLMTEACNGYLHIFKLEKAVELGSWERAEKYIMSIIKYINKGAAGWVDWNMVLDEQGGPTFIKNFVDSPIIVNGTSGEFYKQPMYFVLAHFSKYIIPDSIRIDLSVDEGVKALAFERPDNLTAVIVHNSMETNTEVALEVSSTKIAYFNVEAHSINTIIFK